ncbi:folliculin-like [Huso huso]|uniref:Folliculin-like n=1 Tax=Huso huso TaxID=61971 RepID=A0ABR0Y7X7_HUSHU
MNALVALCHFCELHGPRTLFCTEALHSPTPLETGGGASAQGTEPGRGSSALSCSQGEEGEEPGDGGITMRARDSALGQQATPTTTGSPAPQRADMCEVRIESSSILQD